MINEYLNLVLQGGELSHEQAIALAETTHKEALYEAANTIRKQLSGNFIELCSIMNAKSGKCSENCKFCAQSSHYSTPVEEYELVDADKAIAQAKENRRMGVHKFSLVTSGRTVSLANLDKLGLMYNKIRQETDIELCASMGFLTAEKADKLKSFGVKNYHCNLETSRSFFPQICTTHSYDEKIDTIRLAQQAGFSVCSGGIIGLGETMAQRIEMAIELRSLGVMSIPINILNPIEGTPFSHNNTLTTTEILTTIALFRFINPRAYIRFAGGRAQLGDQQTTALNAGINAALVGNYLTTVGSNIAQDVESFAKEGFSIRQ